jgi:hypothetical protein
MSTIITQDGTFIIADLNTGRSASGRTLREAMTNFGRAA